MPESDSPLELSARGQILALGDDTSEIFEVMRNPWDPETKPDGFLNLGIAENDMMHTKLAAYIEKTFSVPLKYLTYNEGGAGSNRLRAAMARFLTKHFSPVQPIEQEHIVVTNGCSSAVEHMSWALADPGDAFLLGQPFYRAFIPDISMRTGSKVIKVPFGDADPMSLDAVPCYEAVIKKSLSQDQSIKGLILCHPHNPLGRCYPKEVLEALMALCQKYRIHLISDEIYALSTWTNNEDTSPAPTPFISASAIPTKGLIDPHLVHIIWGMSKDFGANGLRIGCVISQANKDLINSLMTLSLYTYPSNMADYITATILEDDDFTDAYIRENREGLSQRFSLAAKYFTAHGVPYARGANAAFFIVADLGTAYRRNHPQVKDGDDVTALVMQQLWNRKVYVVNSNAIGSETPGWFRVVFSQNESYLMEGLRRIVAAVEDGVVSNGEQGEMRAGGKEVPMRPKLDDGQEAPGQGLIA